MLAQNEIQFPKLGIDLHIDSTAFSIFGIDIQWYGLLITCGLLLAMLYAFRNMRSYGIHPDRAIDAIIGGIIGAIVGARAYYVILEWDSYAGDWKRIFNLRLGGLAIYGGLIGALVVGCLIAKIRKVRILPLLDLCGAGFLLGQGIGRWGNFFNREAFGEYTDSLFAMKLPVDAVRSSDITELMRKHMEVVDGVSFIQVHPTFLYESMWCLMVLAVMLLYHRHKKFDGEVFLVYLCGYGLGRVWIEGLRTDQLLIPGIGLPVSQILAGVMVVVSVGLIVYRRSRNLV